MERLRQQQLAGIAQEMTQPGAIAARAMPGLLYGTDHPYGKPFTGSGDPAVVSALTRDELIRFHQTWIRPDNATIYAISDLPLDQLVPQLESRFGNWREPSVPRGTKAFTAQIPAPRPRIVLIDRPQSPQSFILAGEILPVEGTQDLLNLTAANEALGGNFLARINMELRERRGWSYGARRQRQPVRASGALHHPGAGPGRPHRRFDRRDDRAGARLPDQQRRPADRAEPNHQLGNIRQLAGQFETSAAVLGALRSNALYRRPDNYWETVPTAIAG